VKGRLQVSPTKCRDFRYAPTGLPREIRQQEKISPGFLVAGCRFLVAGLVSDYKFLVAPIGANVPIFEGDKDGFIRPGGKENLTGVAALRSLPSALCPLLYVTQQVCWHFCFVFHNLLTVKFLIFFQKQ